jgi:hypothetical protein
MSKCARHPADVDSPMASQAQVFSTALTRLAAYRQPRSLGMSMFRKINVCLITVIHVFEIDFIGAGKYPLSAAAEEVLFADWIDNLVKLKKYI